MEMGVSQSESGIGRGISLLVAGATALYIAHQAPEAGHNLPKVVFQNELQHSHAAIRKFEPSSDQSDVSASSLDMVVGGFQELAKVPLIDESNLEKLQELLERNPRHVAKALMAKWVQKYTTGNMRLSLEHAIRISRPYVAYVKQIFAEEGIPQHWAFLAIQETHWDPQARSERDAVGLYQFLAEIARARGGIVSNKYDSRLHWAENARMAAKNLLAHYNAYGVESLAIALHHSDLVEEYAKKAWENGKELSLDGYFRFCGDWVGKIRTAKAGGEWGSRHSPDEKLDFIVKNLNYIFKFYAIDVILRERHPHYYSMKAKQLPFYVHTVMDEDKSYRVAPGDTWFKIGRMHNIRPETLKEANGAKSDILSIGQQVRVPVPVLLGQIAERYSLPVEQLKGDNPHILNSSFVPPGGRVYIALSQSPISQ
jgi:hypothetical protein